LKEEKSPGRAEVVSRLGKRLSRNRGKILKKKKTSRHTNGELSGENGGGRNLYEVLGRREGA